MVVHLSCVHLLYSSFYIWLQAQTRSCKQVGGWGQVVDTQPVIKDLKHVVIKIGVPYCWFYLFSAIIFVVVGAGKMDLGGMLYAFFFGSEFLMNKYIGFDFMWFLPAMLALMSLKSVWYNSKQIIRNTIILISFILWCLTIFKILQQSIVGQFVPFAISQTFYCIILGVTVRWVLEKQFPAKWQMLVVILLIGICTALLYYNSELSRPNLNVRKIVQLFMPILAFLFLYGIRNILGKFKVLKFIGKYSLQIYLLHVYVLNFLSAFLLHFTQQSIGLGLMVYVITLILCSCVALIMTKIPIFNKVLFPQGV